MTLESSSNSIIAILPAAGLGSRMKSFTNGASKELLPLGGKSVLGQSISEAGHAGVARIVIIASTQKPDLLDSIDGWIRANDVGDSPAISQILQESPTGLAHAVAMVGSEHDALVLLPDTVFYPRDPSRRIADALHSGADIVVAVGLVAEERVHRYGIVDWSPSTGEIRSIVEKPSPKDTESRWAISGRFGLSRAALARLPELISQWTAPGEVHLPPLLNLAIQAGLKGIAIPLEDDEQRFDCGSIEGYEEAVAVIGK